MAESTNASTMTSTVTSSNAPTLSHTQLPPQAALASSMAIQAALTETSSSSLPSQSSSNNPQNDKNPSKITSKTTNPENGNKADSTSSDSVRSSANDQESTPDQCQINDSNNSSSTDIKSDLITIFSSPTDFNVKHPLYSPWTLWFDNASKTDKAKNWDELIQRVMEVESVEEFWGLYHNIVPPSLIHVGSTYYFFKEGIKPAWEDESNQNGGRWSIQLARDKNRSTIDKWWLYTMLAAIGETFETPYTSNGKPAREMSFTNEVTGVIVSSRKTFFRLAIWTRSSDSRSVAENIGRHFKYGVLGMKENSNNKKNGGFQTDCEFQSHIDSQNKKRGGWTV